MRFKPQQVKRAVVLLCISAGVGILQWAVQVAQTGQIVPGNLVTLCVLAFFIYMISQGRNWARITFLVMFLLGAFFSLMTMSQLFVFHSFLTLTLLIGQMFIQILAIGFLFEKESSHWFTMLEEDWSN